MVVPIMVIIISVCYLLYGWFLIRESEKSQKKNYAIKEDEESEKWNKIWREVEYKFDPKDGGR